MTDPWGDLLDTWQALLRAAGLAEKTRRDYLQTTGYFAAWLAERHPGTAPEDVTRAHVVGWFADLARRADEGRLSRTTVGNRFRHLQQWFRFCVNDAELFAASPMYGLRHPKVPRRAVPKLTPEDLVLLIRACEGPGFTARRDLAIVLVLVDTGIRREECVRLNLDDVNTRTQRIRVIGKGDKERTPAFGATTVLAIEKYRRERAKHRDADLPALWLSRHGGRLTAEGIHQMLKRRGRAAGITGTRAHRFRHTLADAWLADGGSETDLMAHMGWETRQMINRYTRDQEQDRAADAHKRHGLADRLLRDPKGRPRR